LRIFGDVLGLDEGDQAELGLALNLRETRDRDFGSSLLAYTSMEDKRVLVIGCSDGIGLATARRLVDSGWNVTGISRRESPLSGAGYVHLVADVASDDYPASLTAIAKERGPFDACIYCAGIAESFDVERIECDERVIAVNLTGALRTARIVLPPMVAAGRGHLVVLSSQADELVSNVVPSYTASKAALSAYFEGVGLALRAKGVAVTNLRFGFVDTKMARAKVKPFQISVDKSAEIVERCLAKQPLRLTRPLRMAVLVAIFRLLQRWRVRLA
jgi:NAD(P)-dependent dehydrogenase (short-subunit alcohol dehydrogenase family)